MGIEHPEQAFAVLDIRECMKTNWANVGPIRGMEIMPEALKGINPMRSAVSSLRKCHEAVMVVLPL